jgi:hypothetical protein
MQGSSLRPRDLAVPLDVARKPCNSRSMPNQISVSDRRGARLSHAVKSISGDGVAQLRHMLGEQDALFLADRHGEIIVVLRLETFRHLARLAPDY